MPDSDQTMASIINGSWSGVIEFDVPVPVVIRLRNDRSGLSGLSDFPQHRRADIPLRELSFEHGLLRFTTNSFGAYAGQFSAAGPAIAGAFSKDGKRYPLTLRPGDNNFSAQLRPQTPRAPFPYVVENVLVDNVTDNCQLAGTLTIPNGKIAAVALLIPGSGPMDRDETVFAHKPFWVIADHLSRHGYAVLRLDDRGVGDSTGDRSAITVDDEARDVAAALDYLQQRADLAGLPTGLIGHSMGGVIGMTVAAHGSIAFLILMAAPGLTVGEAFADRECEQLKAQGISTAAIARHDEFTRALYRDLAERRPDEAIDESQFAALADRYAAAETATVHNTAEWLSRFNEPWFRSALRLIPAHILRQVKAPVLAINGSRDQQTRASSNLNAIARALATSGNARVETIEFAGLNHLFQTCSTGAVFEYPAIEETFAPVALEAIVNWLDALAVDSQRSKTPE